VILPPLLLLPLLLLLLLLLLHLLLLLMRPCERLVLLNLLLARGWAARMDFIRGRGWGPRGFPIAVLADELLRHDGHLSLPRRVPSQITLPHSILLAAADHRKRVVAICRHGAVSRLVLRAERAGGMRLWAGIALARHFSTGSLVLTSLAL